MELGLVFILQNPAAPNAVTKIFREVLNISPSLVKQMEGVSRWRFEPTPTALSFTTGIGPKALRHIGSPTCLINLQVADPLGTAKRALQIFEETGLPEGKLLEFEELVFLTHSALADLAIVFRPEDPPEGAPDAEFSRPWTDGDLF